MRPALLCLPGRFRFLSGQCGRHNGFQSSPTHIFNVASLGKLSIKGHTGLREKLEINIRLQPCVTVIFPGFHNDVSGVVFRVLRVGNEVKVTQMFYQLGNLAGFMRLCKCNDCPQRVPVPLRQHRNCLTHDIRIENAPVITRQYPIATDSVQHLLRTLFAFPMEPVRWFLQQPPANERSDEGC